MRVYTQELGREGIPDGYEELAISSVVAVTKNLILEAE